MTPVMTQIRLVIADDHPIVRAGLQGLLATQEDFAVVGEAANGRETVTIVRHVRPDVVLIDLRMPELDGVGAMLHAQRSSHVRRAVSNASPRRSTLNAPVTLGV